MLPELQRLREGGVNVYYDEGISPGHEWTQELADAIDGCNRVLFFVSSSSVASRHCRNEVQYALEKSKRLISVYLEPTDLPGGLQLSLGSAQAVLKYALTAKDYSRKLSEALASIATGSVTNVGESSIRRSIRRKIATITSITIALLAVMAALIWWTSRSVPEPGYTLESRNTSLRTTIVGVDLPENLDGADASMIRPRLIAEVWSKR